MKRVICHLAILLIVTLLITGCHQAVTPTNVVSNSSQLQPFNSSTTIQSSNLSDSSFNSKEAADSSSSDRKGSVSEDKPISYSSITSSKTTGSIDSTSSVGSKPIVSTPNLASADEKTDIYKKWPTFTGFSAYENWLRTGSSYSSVYNTMSQATANNAEFKGGKYYRPTLKNGNNWIELVEIEVCSNKDGTTTYYRYDISDSQSNRPYDLNIWVAMAGNHVSRSLSNRLKELEWEEVDRSFDDYIIETYNGIKYYVFHHSDDVSYIYWKQNKKYYTADLYNHYDQIHDILPLLTVEGATYNHGGDLVTE